MIHGKRFAWAQLPKTRGDATYAMLVPVAEWVQFADPPESNDKHLHDRFAIDSWAEIERRVYGDVLPVD